MDMEINNMDMQNLNMDDQEDAGPQSNRSDKNKETPKLVVP